jgi:phosphate transport system substrate-binding protein
MIFFRHTRRSFLISKVRCVAAMNMGVLIGALMFIAGSAFAEEIKIGGTGNALGTMRLMGDAFTKKYPTLTVKVLPSIGTSGAIKAVPKGAIDIGVSSRALTDEESATGVMSTEYAQTLTVLAVSSKSKISAITTTELMDIYQGKMPKWPDGAVARPILRQPGDDNAKQIKTLSPDMEKALQVAEKREGLAFAVIDQEAADKIENIPGAVGITTLALIKSEGRSLRALSLDGVEATIKNGANGTYPLIKHFYFVTKNAPAAVVQQFIAFVNSPAGRDVLAKNGNWPP